MAQSETADKILHAATVLFAERGFTETSLRTITGMADVNLAAVNYHFGSKKALINAVFLRFLTPFAEELNRRLDMLDDDTDVGGMPAVEPLLHCLFSSLLVAVNTVDGEPQRFMRLLGLAYSQSQEHLRHSLLAVYGDTYRRYLKLLHEALPHLDPIAFYWRLYFMLGAAVFTLSSFDSIRGILNADYDADTDLNDALHLMVPALTGMLQTPNEH
jgi:AcrR family transcriptional regulator